MPKNSESLNRSLFSLLRTRGYDPIMLNTAGKEVPTPEEAEVFQFNFVKDGEDYGKVTLSIDGLHKLVIYFGENIANSEKEDSHGDEDISWYKLLNYLKRFAQKYQLSFQLKNVDNLKHDMAKREYMKQKESISEGYYPLGKKASYNDAVPSVKIVLQHTRQIEEGEQRYRNIAKIFLENEQGERILAPTIKPGVARVYARHLAEGGLPHDDRWNHINSLVEEYNKMAGFVRATRNGQFNESAQKLVNEGINHYQSLRETLSKMTGHRGYNVYFESWTPALMEDDTDTSNLNELFVQETVDPRIESVMPILSRLQKQISEMAEVNELAEWADNILEAEDELEEGLAGAALGGAAGAALTKTPSGAMLGAKLGSAVQDRLSDEETDDKTDEGVVDKIKSAGKKLVGTLTGPDDEELLKLLQKRAGVPSSAQHGKPSMAEPKEKLDEIPDTQFHEEEEVEESGLQAYLGNKKYGKEGMDALRKAGREHASKEKMAKIRAKYDKLDEEGEFAGDYKTGPEGQWRNVGPKANKPATVGDLVGESQLDEMDKSQPSSDRGGESSGDPYAKGGKGTPAKAKDVAKDAEKTLDKAMDKAHKKDVKEGQEDFDYMLRLLGK